MKKIRVGILGTGNVGTDLLIKIMRSPYLKCICFSGRNENSIGIKKAKELGILTSTKGIDAFLEKDKRCDLVFDATSAQDHYRHAQIFSMLGIRAIDLTPAHIGDFCIPSINGDSVLYESNVNMVTCGGQASTPPIYAISRIIKDISRVEVFSRVAADSIGPATIANIDKYYASTAEAITEFSGIERVSVDLFVDQSEPKPDMLTLIRLFTQSKLNDMARLELEKTVKDVQRYVPGYQLISAQQRYNGCIEVAIQVQGLGDWVPKHAGNLDIINCAAVNIAEKYAVNLYKPRPIERLQDLMLNFYS